MINKLQKFFTGYAKADKKINGVNYQFKFSGKPVFFDPSQMIKELINKTTNLTIRPLSSKENFDTLVSRLPVCPTDLLPGVICSFKTDSKKISVARYSFKDVNFLVSQYVFEIDGEIKGVFSRVYDNGFQLNNFFSKLEGDFDERGEEEFMWKWEAPDSSWITIEKFGHTQLVVWNGELQKFQNYGF
jgi:hypothetical protein